jgi:mannose-6-phosphate isomerase-like protein (cupin superfamily)
MNPSVWHLDDLKAEILEALKKGEYGDGKVIDGRALGVKASPMRDNSTKIVLGMAALPPAFSSPAHSHEAEEMAVFLSGSGSVYIDDRAYPFVPGTVVLIPSGSNHLTATDMGDEPIVILWFYAPPGSERRWIEPAEHGASSYGT